jgi:hypothetical protein
MTDNEHNDDETAGNSAFELLQLVAQVAYEQHGFHEAAKLIRSFADRMPAIKELPPERAETIVKKVIDSMRAKMQRELESN